MSRQMRELQDSLPSTNVRLVSLTTDPEYDSPAILQKYAERFGANPQRWLFLTGTKEQIAALAGDSLKLAAVEKTPQERQSPVDLFIHSTIFVIVDKSGRLRSIIQTAGDDEAPRDVKKDVLAAVRYLEREP